MPDQPNTGQRLEQNLAGLEHALRTLRRDLDALSGRIGDVEATQTQHGEQVHDVQARLDDLVEVVDEQDGLLGDVRADVGRLVSRIDWLQHHLAQLTDLEPVELVGLDAGDDGLADLVDLVDQVRAGHDADATLLGEQERADLEARSQSYTELRAEKLGWDRRLVALSRTFVDPPAAGEGRLGTEAAFDEAVRQSDARTEKLRLANPRVRSDRQRLSRDDDERARVEPVIHAGLRARARLQDRMLDRIDTAVANRDALPAWFTTSFGYGPPAGATHWLDTAADVLAYRLVHEVDDPETALGDLPPDATPAQRRWHDQLTTRLDDLHRP